MKQYGRFEIEVGDKILVDVAYFDTYYLQNPPEIVELGDDFPYFINKEGDKSAIDHLAIKAIIKG